MPEQPMPLPSAAEIAKMVATLPPPLQQAIADNQVDFSNMDFSNGNPFTQQPPARRTALPNPGWRDKPRTGAIPAIPPEIHMHFLTFCVRNALYRPRWRYRFNEDGTATELRPTH